MAGARTEGEGWREGTTYSDHTWTDCYIAPDAVDNLIAAYGVEVEWRAFEPHPELPPEGGSLGDDPGRTKMFRARLQESAEEAGMQMRFADKVSNSRLALEATEYARTQGKLEAFHRGVFDAYFGNAENIGLADVLARVGEAAGLNPAELRRVLEDRR